MSSYIQLHHNKKTKIIQASTINKIIEYVYYQNFTEILLKDKSTFINNFESQIIEMIKSNNKGSELNYKSDLTLYQNQKPSLISRYESDYSLLNTKYIQYKENPKEISYFVKYRKHCINSDVTPLHKCILKNSMGKFIEVKNSRNSSNNNYVICSECRFCYKTSFIKVYCSDCKCEYFTSKLNDNEDGNILPATWKEYHCDRIIVNEIMKCIKCQKILYLNLISMNLVCLNKACMFSTNPRSIMWKCKICKKDFRSLAKVYNPLEKTILENEIWKALILKQKAKPKIKICCLKNEKNENVKYFHDKYCKGELFSGKVNNKEIIVCGKCHAVNLYDKFIWTCPKCNKKISNIHNKEQNERNSSNNKINIKVKNNLKLENENNTNKNSNELNKSKENSYKKINEKTNSKNDLIFQYYFTQRKNNKNINKKINEAKKDKILKLKKDLTNPILGHNTYLIDSENKFKSELKHNYFKNLGKFKYQTLFDILEEREKFKLENQSIEGNKGEKENVEIIKLAKSNLDMKYSKRRKKLLEESYLSSSKKNHKKIIIKNDLIHSQASNSEKKFLISKEIIKKNLSSDMDEEINGKVYKDLLYSKRYKDEHSTTTNEDYEKIEFRKNTKSSNKNHKNNLDHRKIYLKEKDNFIEIQNSPNKKFDKNMPDEKNYSRNINQNNSLDFSQQKKDQKESNSYRKEKNQLIKRIYLDKINLNRKERLARSKDNIKEIFLKEIPKPINGISPNPNNTDIINKSEINLSPFDSLTNNLLSKQDFLSISKDCKIPPFKESDINYLNTIEIGTTEVIYLVEDKKVKKKYALKRVICRDISDIIKYKKEFELCYLLNHSNLIKIYNIFFKYIDTTTYLLYILMEKAESNLENEIEKRAETKNYYTEKELIRILKQLIDVLFYLQKKGIAHRNIKPQNILICENNIYKLTDLGEAKENNSDKLLSTLKGNQLFMAPNLFFMLKYDGNCLKVKHNLYKSDVFSLGYCFLYAMALDIKIIKNLREENSMNDVNLIIKKYEIDKRYSENFMNVIYKMIQTDENKRYDFFELNDNIKKIFKPF